jgi:hypothetical protein
MGQKRMRGIKGSNIIIAIGVLAIFIAAFFTLFSYDKLILTNVSCITQTMGECTPEIFESSTYGLFLIFGLIVMIAAAVYVMFISIKMDRYK